MIKALTGKAGVKFNFVNNAKIDDEKFFDFTEVGISNDDYSTINDYIRKSDFSDEALVKTEELLSKVKQYIYTKFNSSEIDDVVRK
ncbi:MAG: hypothetical protein Nk1A_7910 [Endomicrobiia bacterium]|nr:MAG: hypothetical protein Nk1A_7910 [Endomicrobiia bacterium]